MYVCFFSLLIDECCFGVCSKVFLKNDVFEWFLELLFINRLVWFIGGVFDYFIGFVYFN